MLGYEILFQVSQHSELAWLLSCLTPTGWLNKMTQWKVQYCTMETIVPT